jgi:preprotein translocase subunit SecE
MVGLGLWRLYDTLIAAPIKTRYGVPAVVGLILGWIIYRVVQYPPFVEFLIATEAEMNKVSWTSRDDLYRATTVVLSTVVLMSVFLFGVDWVWSNLLQLIGVLKFGGGGAFGSSA